MLAAHAVPAAAQFGRPFSGLRAGANIMLDARYARTDSPSMVSELADTLTAGLRVRAYAGKSIGYMAGIDAHFGAGLQGGFSYDANLLPIGLAVPIGKFALIGIVAGVGVNGVTEHVPFALQFPVEVTVDLQLGSHLHLGGWASTRWIAASESRVGGSDAAPFGDELELAAVLRVGRAGKRRINWWANGYYIGGTYNERMGTRFMGAIFGFSVDMGVRAPTRRRRSRPHMPRLPPQKNRDDAGPGGVVPL